MESALVLHVQSKEACSEFQALGPPFRSTYYPSNVHIHVHFQLCCTACSTQKTRHHGPHCIGLAEESCESIAQVDHAALFVQGFHVGHCQAAVHDASVSLPIGGTTEHVLL
eukprot:GHRR01029957.1.p2 GENE.GHRR01029957.1~~GHRR01029957.1.p2  ORF type:complete len:111 (-),score=8.40 GHRR01029957.1:1020-1352(-)